VPDSDFYQVTECLNEAERDILRQVRAFMESKIAPIITKYWADEAFPYEVLPAFRDLKIGGVGYQGYECRGGSTLLDGFVQMELARVDPSFSTFLGVHNGLALGSVYLGGSEEQKQKMKAS
jgi:alkylation response protein AidB-like acyl-CoA dehydrogenase